jgi:hypothetical protein
VPNSEQALEAAGSNTREELSLFLISKGIFYFNHKGIHRKIPTTMT